MTIEERVAYLEALLANLHRQGLPGGPIGPLGGLVVETQWSHKSAFSIGTLHNIGLRAEVENPRAGSHDPADVNDPGFSATEVNAVYGTAETAPKSDIPLYGVTGNATNGGRGTAAVRGRAQFQPGDGMATTFFGQEIDGAGNELTSIRISPQGIQARSGRNPLGSHTFWADDVGFRIEGGYVYHVRRDPVTKEIDFRQQFATIIT